MSTGLKKYWILAKVVDFAVSSTAIDADIYTLVLDNVNFSSAAALLLNHSVWVVCASWLWWVQVQLDFWSLCSCENLMWTHQVEIWGTGISSQTWLLWEHRHCIHLPQWWWWTLDLKTLAHVYCPQNLTMHRWWISFLITCIPWGFPLSICSYILALLLTPLSVLRCLLESLNNMGPCIQLLPKTTVTPIS